MEGMTVGYGRKERAGRDGSLELEMIENLRHALQSRPRPQSDMLHPRRHVRLTLPGVAGRGLQRTPSFDCILCQCRLYLGL